MFGDVLYLVAGGVATWLLQTVKAVFKLSGRGMVWAAVFVSLVLGVAVTGLSNPAGFAAILAAPWLIFTGGSAVFATAQVIYKELAAKYDLSVEGMVNAPDATAKSIAAPRPRAAAPSVLKIGAKKVK
jgi:hypothetical protein